MQPGLMSCGAVRPHIRRTNKTGKEPIMLKWAVIFLIISLVAGLLGFTGIAAIGALMSD